MRDVIYHRGPRPEMGNMRTERFTCRLTGQSVDLIEGTSTTYIWPKGQKDPEEFIDRAGAILEIERCFRHFRDRKSASVPTHPTT